MSEVPLYCPAMTGRASAGLFQSGPSASVNLGAAQNKLRLFMLIESILLKDLILQRLITSLKT